MALQVQHLIKLILVASLSLKVSSKCSDDVKMEFMRDNLGPGCRSSIELIFRADPPLDSVDFDPVCTTDCMGRYSNWLQNQCEDISSAKIARVACLKNAGGTRCRYAFPDLEESSIFSSTQQCGSLLPSPTLCTRNCREPLNILENIYGCCFFSIYNNSDIIMSLSEVGFLDSTKASVLSSFQTSGLLDLCQDDTTPSACSGEPFTDTTGPAVTDSSSKIHGHGVMILLFSVLLLVSCF